MERRDAKTQRFIVSEKAEGAKILLVFMNLKKENSASQ